MFFSENAGCSEFLLIQLSCILRKKTILIVAIIEKETIFVMEYCLKKWFGRRGLITNLTYQRKSKKPQAGKCFI